MPRKHPNPQGRIRSHVAEGYYPEFLQRRGIMNSYLLGTQSGREEIQIREETQWTRKLAKWPERVSMQKHAESCIHQLATMLLATAAHFNQASTLWRTFHELASFLFCSVLFAVRCLKKKVVEEEEEKAIKQLSLPENAKQQWCNVQIMD